MSSNYVVIYLSNIDICHSYLIFIYALKQPNGYLHVGHAKSMNMNFEVLYVVVIECVLFVFNILHYLFLFLSLLSKSLASL